MAGKRFLLGFEKAVSEFNSGYYFKCHDTLEEIWLDAPPAEKSFYQGILHVAVGLYHFENENYKGAFSQLTKAELLLVKYTAVYHGVQLDDLLTQAKPFCLCARQKTEDGTAQIDVMAFPILSWNKEQF